MCFRSSLKCFRESTFMNKRWFLESIMSSESHYFSGRAQEVIVKWVYTLTRQIENMVSFSMGLEVFPMKKATISPSCLHGIYMRPFWTVLSQHIIHYVILHYSFSYFSLKSSSQALKCWCIIELMLFYNNSTRSTYKTISQELSLAIIHTRFV